MNVLVYTLTRDRLELTQHAFASLEARAGHPYQHLVIDNGSTDGTKEWLVGWVAAAPERRQVLSWPENRGISAGSNAALATAAALAPAPDLVVKMDNDCEVVTPDLLRRLVAVFQDRRRFAEYMALSPRVEGINRQPKRLRVEGRGGLTVGVTGMVGGLFHVLPWAVYSQWRYPENLPKAWGQDDALCSWLNQQGVLVGYVEELEVRHYLTTDGQAVKFPDYFIRKRQEEERST